MAFDPAVVEDLLVKSARSCCLCRQFKGQKLEIHHIDQSADGGGDTADNGIPLCFDCHADVASYNDKHPRGRKYRPGELKRLRDDWFELVASGKIGGHLPAVPQDDDLELIRFYSQCLDRPALQDEFHLEGSMEDFDHAIADTITAINTGCQRSRDGHELATAKGKSSLANPAWRDTMDTIADVLGALRSRYAAALNAGEIHLGPQQPNGSRFYSLPDGELAEWFDSTRHEIVTLFNQVCRQSGIPELRFPRRGRHRFPYDREPEPEDRWLRWLRAFATRVEREWSCEKSHDRMKLDGAKAMLNGGATELFDYLQSAQTDDGMPQDVSARLQRFINDVGAVNIIGFAPNARETSKSTAAIADEFWETGDKLVSWLAKYAKAF
jgi:hypothetical protein